MRKFIYGLLAGAVLSAIVAYNVCGLRIGAYKVAIMSMIDTPIRNSLDSVVESYDTGDTELAEAKVRLIRERWYAYIDLSDPPYGLGQIGEDVRSLKRESDDPTSTANPSAHEKAE